MKGAVIGAVLAALLALPGSARAERGALTQLPAEGGCISEGGTQTCTDGDLLDGAFSVAVSRDGRNAYAALVDGRAIAAFSRDRVTGALTQLPSPQGCIGRDEHGGLCTE